MNEESHTTSTNKYQITIHKKENGVDVEITNITKPEQPAASMENIDSALLISVLSKLILREGLDKEQLRQLYNNILNESDEGIEYEAT